MGAAEILSQDGIEAAVFSYPEITAEPNPELVRRLADFSRIFVLENHNPANAKFRRISDALAAHDSTKVLRIGVDGIPANGQPVEVLEHHRLDAKSIAAEVADRESSAKR
jgi:transketolase C-terminal domain/subunit